MIAGDVVKYLKKKVLSSYFVQVSSFAGGNIVSMIFRILGGFLVGRFIAPVSLGLFNSIGLVLGYMPFMQLGILSGLNRELPYCVGKKEYDKVKDLAAAAQFWSLLVGGLVFIVLLCVSIWQLSMGKYMEAAGWMTNAALGVFLFYNTNYLQLTYRTSSDFSRLAFVSVIESVSGFIMLLLVIWLNYYGLCLRALLIGAISTSILYYWRPIKVGPKMNMYYLKYLFKIGAPILFVGVLYSWWSVFNLTLVLKYAGTEGLGLYSMVVMASTALDVIPLAVKQVTYPRLAEEYGKTHSVQQIVKLIRKPVILTSISLIPMIIVAWIIIEPIMKLFVPTYVNAVSAMRWALLLSFVGGFGSVTNIFNVVKRQDLFVMAIFLGILAYGASLVYLINDSVSLSDFPKAMLVGQAVFMLFCYIFVIYLYVKEKIKKIYLNSPHQ